MSAEEIWSQFKFGTKIRKTAHFSLNHGLSGKRVRKADGNVIHFYKD